MLCQRDGSVVSFVILPFPSPPGMTVVLSLELLLLPLILVLGLWDAVREAWATKCGESLDGLSVASTVPLAGETAAALMDADEEDL